MPFAQHRCRLTLLFVFASVLATERPAAAQSLPASPLLRRVELSPADERQFEFFGHSTDGATPVFRDSDSPDRDELRRLIREELRAEMDASGEKDAQKGQDRDSDTGSRGSERTESKGQNLSLKDVWTNGFVAESSDKDFRIHLGGRLDWDNAWFQQDDNLLIGPDPSTRLEDGTAMRRARLRADGTVYGWIDFATEVNFANIQDVPNVDNDLVQVGSVGITDFFLTFRNLPVVGNLRAGHFVAPYSLERYTSSNVLYYMEYSPVVDAFFGPNMWQSGLMLFDSFCDDRVTLASSFTRIGKATVSSFGFGVGDGLYAGGIRATALPIYADGGRLLLHVGANYFQQSLDQNRFEIANRFPLRAGGGTRQVPNIVRTSIFFSPDDARIADAELALVCGPLSLSAEYACSWITNVFEQFSGGQFQGPRGDVGYHAAYLEGGYFLTRGDYRRYDRKTGTWARTIPRQNISFKRDGNGESYRCGCGALQLLTRLSYLDLVSGSPTLTPTSGGARAGIQKDLTAGINWYLNPQTIVSMNYVFTRIDSVVAGASGDIHGIGTRLHFDF